MEFFEKKEKIINHHVYVAESVKIITFSRKIIYPFRIWISPIYTASSSFTFQMSYIIDFYRMLQAYV